MSLTNSKFLIYFSLTSVFFYIHHGNVDHKKYVTRFWVWGVRVKKWDLVGPQGGQRSGQVKFLNQNLLVLIAGSDSLQKSKIAKFPFFRWVHPSLYEGVSVRPSVGPSVGL